MATLNTIIPTGSRKKILTNFEQRKTRFTSLSRASVVLAWGREDMHAQARTHRPVRAHLRVVQVLRAHRAPVDPLVRLAVVPGGGRREGEGEVAEKVREYGAHLHLCEILAQAITGREGKRAETRRGRVVCHKRVRVPEFVRGELAVGVAPQVGVPVAGPGADLHEGALLELDVVP